MSEDLNNENIDQGSEGENLNNSTENLDNKNTENDKVVFESQKQFQAVINRKIAKALKAENDKRDQEKQKESLTENEKLKLQIEESNKKAAEREAIANKRLIKAEITTIGNSLNIIDTVAAYKLLDKEDIEVDEKGNVTGVEKALKALIAEKPWLLKQDQKAVKVGDETKNTKNSTPKSGNDFNTIIRNYRSR
jgi:hypothetical protein